MLAYPMNHRCRPLRWKQLLCCAAAVSFFPQASWLAAQEEPVRLIDQPPFDRVTLKDSHEGEVIDTLLLELPDRRLPHPLPNSGKLELKRVSQPSVLYAVSWEAIAKIELYEQMLLSKAIELTNEKKFVEAYAYLQFLHTHYAKLEGLQKATEQYLKRDARNEFSEKRYDQALSVLLSLYDLNPQHVGLAEAVQAVSDRLISSHLASRNFSAARSVLDSVESAFSQIEIKSIGRWRKKFASGAKQQLGKARRSLDAGHYQEARQAAARALAIFPSLAGAQGLITELNRLSPQVTVGVSQHSVPRATSQLGDPGAVSVARLTNPQLVELSGFGGEGGVYTCRWANLVVDDSGLELDMRLNKQARNAGIYPEMLALQLARMADFSTPQYREGFASLLKHVAIRNGQEVRLHWRRPHVRPEALLQIPLSSIFLSDSFAGAYEVVPNTADQGVIRYTPPNPSAGAVRSPVIVQQVYASEEEALTALVRGDVDVLDRIAPWQIDRLRQAKEIFVGSYLLPTIHVLVPNYSKPLLRRREFRRALCYGIDRQRIVKEILLGGRTRRGFQVLSGPLPAGVSLSDPLGYAYQQGIQPRPYEPRLAAVLATVARTTLAKKAANHEPTQEGAEQKPSPPEVVPLVLAYPPDALARTACQTIKLQLDAIGVPIQLKELSPFAGASSVDFDLRYTELPLWEPLVDLRRLLGPTGRVGHCSPAMSFALKAVDQARNWKQARARLRHVHEVAFHDLPVVPLWQTVNAYAQRRELRGIGKTPVTLYQNVADWEISYVGAGQ